MNAAYIILAHKNIKQLNLLLNKLNSHNSFFFVHIDAKVGNTELSLLHYNPEHVKLLPRVNVKWADFSLVDVTITALGAINASGIEFNTITLLSGQDYPIKSNEYISAFFKNSNYSVFLDHYPLPNYNKWKNGGGMYRVTKYFFGLKEYQLFASRLVNLTANLIPFLNRKLPGKLQPYAGSQWWTIDTYAMHYILDFVKSNPAYSSFHKVTFAPDELFFHTILLNAKDEKISSSICNDNKTFIRWQSQSTAHPEFLKVEDIRDLRNSDALFARKFDINDQPDLFELIDRECHNKQTAAA